MCVSGAERQEFSGRGQACPRADGVGPGRVEAAWSMRECPGTRGKIVGNDQNVQRCESTGILWEAVAEPDGAKEATGKVGPDRLGFAGRMRWNDQVRGGEVRSGI